MLPQSIRNRQGQSIGCPFFFPDMTARDLALGVMAAEDNLYQADKNYAINPIYENKLYRACMLDRFDQLLREFKELTGIEYQAWMRIRAFGDLCLN